MQPRAEDGPLDGYYEFPGGKIERGESPREACLRELGEEIGFSQKELVKIEKKLTFFKLEDFEYEDRKVALYCFFHQGDLPELKARGEWKSLKFNASNSDFHEKILPANRLIIDELLEFLTLSQEYLNSDEQWQRLSQLQNFF